MVIVQKKSGIPPRVALAILAGILVLPIVLTWMYELSVRSKHRHWTTVTGSVWDAQTKDEQEPGVLMHQTSFHVEIFLQTPQGTRMARSGSANFTMAGWQMERWMRTHPTGTPVEVRLDPEDSQRAELVDMSDLTSLHYSRFNLTEMYMVGIAFAIFGLVKRAASSKGSPQAVAGGGRARHLK